MIEFTETVYKERLSKVMSRLNELDSEIRELEKQRLHFLMLERDLHFDNTKRQLDESFTDDLKIKLKEDLIKQHQNEIEVLKNRMEEVD